MSFSCPHSISGCFACASLPLCPHGCALAPGWRCVLCEVEAQAAAARARGAFRALAELGCAVQLGLLAVAVASRQVCRWDGPEPGVRVWCGDVERSLLVALGSQP